MKQTFVTSLLLFYYWFAIPSPMQSEALQKDSLSYYNAISQNKKNSFQTRLDANNKTILIASNLSDSLYLSQRIGKMSVYYDSKKYTEAIIEGKKTLEEARQRNQKHFIALSYQRLALYYRLLENENDAFKYYVKAMELSSELKDSLTVIEVSKRAAFIQANFGDLEGAEFTIVNGLDYSSAVTDLSDLVWHYDILARIYRERTLWEEATRYHRKAIQLENEPLSKITVLNNYGVTLIKSQNYLEALVQFEKASSYKNNLNGNIKNRLLDNIAFAKSKLKDPEAIPLLEEALELREKDNDIIGQFASHIHLAEAYKNNQNTLKTKYHAQKAYNIATIQLRNNKATVQALDFLIPVTKSSKALFEEYTALSDSLTAAENKAKFEFAKLRYDVEKAEERETLALRQKTASELREEIAISKRNWAFAGVIAIFLVGLGFTLFQRERSKKQRLLDRHQTEKRIAKKLHDELANEVYLVMNQLEGDSTPPAIADKLDHIYKLTRDISRETQPIDTGDTFPEELALNLQTYTSSNRKLILRGLESIDWKVVKSEKKIEIYRVLQELMTNMRKHSEASLVALVFKEEDELIEINYSDNGQGATLSLDNRGSGLANTETRLKSLGGKITFDSAINEGFRAELSIPV